MIALEPTWSLAASSPSPKTRWLWDGFLAPGCITLLTSQWKSGKSTLLSLLLDHRTHSAPLLDRPVAPGRTAVVSEEDLLFWQLRRQRLDFGAQVCFFCRPFSSRPTRQDWQNLLGTLLKLHLEQQVDLIVIDPLSVFLPVDENIGQHVAQVLHSLRTLTQRGLSLLLLHHPAKGEVRPGQAARGTGVLSSFVDILLEMRLPGGDPFTRRRLLHGYSRFEETPRHLLMELNPEGTDYQCLSTSDLPLDPNAATPNLVLSLLRDAPEPMTAKDLLSAWPLDLAPPSTATLTRTLSRALAQNLLQRTGSGTKSDPYHYRPYPSTRPLQETPPHPPANSQQ